MAAFDDPAFDDHERVIFCRDAVTGLKAIIAIHSTALGPAAGGCRLWQYDSDDSALHDVLRLSQGMSYKNAMAGLDFGGGKAVILKTADFRASDALFERFGEFVDQLDGEYVTAEDVGMSVPVMQTIARRTRYVSGLPQRAGHAGGDPSPKTAFGVFTGIGAAAAVHASATMPNFLIYEYMVGAEDVSRDMTKGYNEPVDGYLELPKTPGLGIEIDESKLDQYRYEEYPKRGIRTVEDERKWH